MKKAFEFDFVFDTQFVFRQLLDAMANPMRKISIKKLENSFPQSAYLKAIGCTLLDNEATFYVEKNSALADSLTGLTLSSQRDINEADYIFFSGELNYETVATIFDNAKKGTLADPHKSATVILYCESFEGENKIKVVSPGIKDFMDCRVSEYVQAVLEIKQKIDCEYPCGLDLIFLNDKGEIFAYPRLARLVKEEK